MDDITMNGVAPLRWAAMRKRVDVLQRFAAIDKPTAKDRQDAAEQLELSANQFKRLVRSWRLHKNPAALNGAGAPEHKRAHRSDGLDNRVLGIITAAIDLHGPSDQPTVISNTVWSECDRRSLKRPSNGTIWNYIRKARRAAGPIDDAGREIIIGRAWAELPVWKTSDEAELIRPELLVALRMPEREIVGFATDLQLAGPPVLGDLDVSEQDRPIVVTQLDAGITECNRPQDRLTFAEDANARFARMMGPAIGNIALTFRLPRSDASKLLTSVLDAPLSPQDAILAIQYAMNAHNKHVKSQSKAEPANHRE